LVNLLKTSSQEPKKGFVLINVVSKCWNLRVDTKFKMATIGGETLHTCIIFMGNTFSPSFENRFISFWDPLYILHLNLTEMISGAPLVTNCYRHSGWLKIYIDWSFKNFTRAYENQVIIVCY
jgi:hypothetical protein